MFFGDFQCAKGRSYDLNYNNLDYALTGVVKEEKGHMSKFTLANVLLERDDFVKEYPGLYVGGTGVWRYDEAESALACKGEVSFLSYFNALSWSKWKRYSVVEEVWLHLEAKGGPFTVLCAEADARCPQGAVREEPLLEVGEPSDEYRSYEMRLPASDAVLLSFALRSEEGVLVRGARFFVDVDEGLVRPVRLALATTTFRKEDYIVPNIESVRREILECDEPVSQGFHLFVIDNGRTLDAEALSGAGVTVLPNANVGGSGGFARGMMEGLAWGATHVLLMDDDVRVFPESIKRTFSLLSLLNDTYEEAFLNGAMLSLEQPNHQYEDVAFVRRDGLYDRIKPDFLVDDPKAVVESESMDVEVDNAYGAWWYCCIPASVIKRKGLPLPIFVRCDDVEYGMRCDPTMMCMNGVCVWHASFEGRFRASVDCYQYVRNFLVMIAVSGKSSERFFMLRLRRTFDIYLRAMCYESAELLLDGLEDYLKGPDFLASADGEALMKANGAKNEKLVPLDEVDPALLAEVKADIGCDIEPDDRGLLLKFLEALPHDRHMLPDFLLSDRPAAVYYCRGAYPGTKTMRRRRLVAFDAEGENVHVREIDRARYRALRARYRALKREYAARKGELQDAYRAAFPRLTSADFWREYLGLNGGER